MTTTTRADRATDATFELGEGPSWDPRRGLLRWVDIEVGAVLEGRLTAGGVEVTGRRVHDGTVGAVVVAEDGTLLLAGTDRLVVVRPDGTVVDGPVVTPRPDAHRCNDGATDPAGRFVVGTIRRGAPAPDNVLVRWEDDGSVTVLDDDLTLSNGLAWSTDGRRLYSVDSTPGLVLVRGYDPATGATGRRRVHLEVDGGEPDGIAVDAEDHLWVAVWGAGEVRRHAPDGRLVARVRTGAPHTTSLTFAGADLRTMVITTARQGLDAHRLREAPSSGALFVTEVEVPGRPTVPWNARPLAGVDGRGD